jgi:two-component system OmpR family sensor kinase
MVVAVAALVGVGLILADVSGLLLLRQVLINRVDQQLHSQYFRGAYGGPGGNFDQNGTRASGLEPRNSVQFMNFDGSPATRNGAVMVPAVSLGSFASLVPHADQGPYTVNLPDNGAWRVEVRRVDTRGYNFTTPFNGYVATGVSLTEVDATEGNLIFIDVTLSVLVLAAIGFVAAWLVRVGLRPLTRMEDAAAEIAGGDLSRRVEDADPHTESGRLGLALNTMLVRIETAMADKTASEQRLRQFLADAAHELRTPLTSIQGFAELYRRGGAEPGPALEEAMGAIEGEVGRMRLLVNDLLMLARLDEERPVEHGPVDLLAVAADAVRDAHVRVPARFVLLGPLDDDDDTFDPVSIEGDEARLRQVATNLVANALQHTPDDAEIVVRVGRLGAPAAGEPPTAAVGDPLPADEPVAVLEVADTGQGMAPADAARAFERLFRVEGSRSRRRGGAGLGLSIVAGIVQAHHGRVELFTAPEAGARFRVLLPATPGLADDDSFIVEGDDVDASELLSEDGAHSEVALR